MSERTRRLLTMLGTAVLVPFAVAALQSVRERPRAAPAQQPVHVVACPQMKVASSARESGWLGAAAATLACDRIRLRLGGRPESALPPAALLPDIGLRPDARVFEARDSAASQRVLANERGDAVLEGEVLRGNDFQVTLRLVDHIGNELGKGNGAHVSLVGAIRMASDMLGDEAHLTAAKGDTDLARALPGASLDAILATHDLAVHALTGDEEELGDACDAARARKDLGTLAATVASVCDPWGGRPDWPAPGTERVLRGLFFGGHGRGDAVWLPWERIGVRRGDASAD